MGVVALDELVLHGWDLARATGQPFNVDSASVQACLGFAASMSEPSSPDGEGRVEVVGVPGMRATQQAAPTPTERCGGGPRQSRSRLVRNGSGRASGR